MQSSHWPLLSVRRGLLQINTGSSCRKVKKKRLNFCRRAMHRDPIMLSYNYPVSWGALKHMHPSDVILLLLTVDPTAINNTTTQKNTAKTKPLTMQTHSSASSPITYPHREKQKKSTVLTLYLITQQRDSPTLVFPLWSPVANSAI